MCLKRTGVLLSISVNQNVICMKRNLHAVLFNNADEFKKRRLPVVYGFIKCYSRALGTKKLIIYKFSILLNKYIFFYIITCTCI